MKPRTPSAQLAGQAGKCIAMYRRELADRAAIFYRLGYSEEQATARLLANAEWDFEIGTGPRPRELDARAIAEIVKATFARRPAH